jgi:hypothetical protein
VVTAAAVNPKGRPALVSTALRPEAIGVLALVVLAGVARWPYLALIPRTTDEAGEVLIAFRIAAGHELPLTSNSPFIGGVVNYLAALMVMLVGPSLESARLTSLVLGALTVLPTYLLGRSLGGRPVGLIAASLMAASATHIAVNSHIAWSSAATPFFTTLALWLLHDAIIGHAYWRLVLGSVAFGLAFQTHPPTVWALAPGIVAAAALARVPWRMAGWAAGAFLLGASNLVLSEIRTRGEGIGVLLERVGNPSGSAPTPPATWPERLVLLGHSMAASLGGLVSETDSVAGAFGHPPVLVHVALALGGLALLVRRRELLLPLVGASVLLLLPLATGSFDPVVDKSRYFAALLPVGYVTVAVALGRFRRVGAVLAVLLIGGQLAGLANYYDQAERTGQTNRPVFAALGAIQQARARGETVYLDRQLRSIDTYDGGSLMDPFRLMLSARGYPYRQLDLARDTGSNNPRLLVLAEESVSRAERRYRLEPLPGEPGGGSPVRVFRATMRNGPLGQRHAVVPTAAYRFDDRVDDRGDDGGTDERRAWAELSAALRAGMGSVARRE